MTDSIPTKLSIVALTLAGQNDLFRLRPIHGGIYGRAVQTQMVTALPEDDKIALYHAVSEFTDFTDDNDPYGEHDFGKVAIADVSYFWKIDYYDVNYEYGSEDRTNSAVTRRVLTIMHTSEY